MLGYTDSTPSNPHYAAPGDVIGSVDVNLQITYQWQGAPMTFDCVGVPTTGFSYPVPSTPPGGAPSTSITILLSPPTAALAGCTNSWDGSPVDLSFPPGSPWELEIGLPAAHTVVGTPHAGTLSGRITVPSGSSGDGTVTQTLRTYPSDIPGQPCTVQWPAYATDLEVPWTYDPSIGVLEDDGSQPVYDLNTTASPANCSDILDWVTIQEASVTLSGPDGATPTMVWAP
ncbi:hypothetical protein RB608_27570 [Nocardioides sp. LHD-245]|uniref:hypothetical protein n=1 Tax=Nocardioides sp. LHD-245 TaxID=3051387 RepID=UPI0027E0B346|nr:hypothetical protein [Nocardioides sp. LHD-245]